MTEEMNKDARTEEEKRSCTDYRVVISGIDVCKQISAVIAWEPDTCMCRSVHYSWDADSRFKYFDPGRLLNSWVVIRLPVVGEILFPFHIWKLLRRKRGTHEIIGYKRGSNPIIEKRCERHQDALDLFETVRGENVTRNLKLCELLEMNDQDNVG